MKPVGKKGKRMEDSAILADFVSSLRREFSCTGVRAQQSRLLLDRLELIAGEGAAEGARRRRAAAAAEEAAAAEQSAQRSKENQYFCDKCEEVLISEDKLNG